MSNPLMSFDVPKAPDGQLHFSLGLYWLQVELLAPKLHMQAWSVKPFQWQGADTNDLLPFKLSILYNTYIHDVSSHKSCIAQLSGQYITCVCMMLLVKQIMHSASSLDTEGSREQPEAAVENMTHFEQPIHCTASGERGSSKRA